MDDRPQLESFSILEASPLSAFRSVKPGTDSLEPKRMLHHSSSTNCKSSSAQLVRLDAGFRNWMLERDFTIDCTKDNDLEPPIPLPSYPAFFGERLRKSRKKRRARTNFTTQQMQALQEQYGRSEYLTRPQRHKLATQLSLNEDQVKIWYQNHRAKDRRVERATWVRQYRCLDVGAVAGQLSTEAATYGLQAELSGQLLLHYHSHMFPSSACSAASLSACLSDTGTFRLQYPNLPIDTRRHPAT